MNDVENGNARALDSQTKSQRSNSVADSTTSGYEITYTPLTHRISKAKKGLKVHVCEVVGCGKVFTRAEHRKRHEASHIETALLRCKIVECGKRFQREDLLARHLAKQHGLASLETRLPLSGPEATSTTPTIPFEANEPASHKTAPGSPIIPDSISTLSDRVNIQNSSTSLREGRSEESESDPYRQPRHSISPDDVDNLTQGTLNMLNLNAVRLETTLRFVVKRFKTEGNLPGALNELERLIGGCIFLHGSLSSEYLSCAIDLASVYSELSRFEDRNRIIKQILSTCNTRQVSLSQGYQEQLLDLLVDYCPPLSTADVDSIFEWLWAAQFETRIVLPYIVRILQNRRQFDKAMPHLLKALDVLENSGYESSNKLFDTILDLLLVQLLAPFRQSDVQCLLEKFWPHYTIYSTRLEPACAISLAKALSANYLFDEAEKIFHDPWLCLEKSDNTATGDEEILQRGLQEMGSHYERRAKYRDTEESARLAYWQLALRYYSQAHYLAVKQWGLTHTETELTWKLLSEARARMDIHPNSSAAEKGERIQSSDNAIDSSTQIGRHICHYPGCCKTFHRAGDLKRHGLMHEERKRFNCDVQGCRYNGERGFYRRDKLLSHQRNVHGMHL